jgi:hypothetical protein
MSDTEEKTLKQQLKEELGKCVLIDVQEKAFWLENLDALPYISVVNVLETVRAKNILVDKYLVVALENGGIEKYVQELRKKIQLMKSTAYSIEEKAEAEEAEGILQSKLNKV